MERFRPLIFSCSMTVLLAAACNKDNNLVATGEAFTGITQTGSFGPEPIGGIDPDDWKALDLPPGSSEGDATHPVPTRTMMYPAYPNPTSNGCLVRFDMAWRDSVQMRIDEAPGKTKRVVFSERKGPGVHFVTLSLDDYPSGIYRVYLTVIRPAATYATYGDIWLLAEQPYR